MANRYTQVQANRFNPLSMQEMAFAPSIMRKQHDALEDKSDELGLFKNDYLSSDEDTINPLVQNYKQEIDSFSDKLNKEGFNSMSRSDIRKLASKKRNLENEYINKSRANKAAMAKYAEQMQKTKGWSPEEVNSFINQQTSGFKSFGEDGQYNQFSGSYLPNYIDEGKWIDEKLKNINYDEYGITPQEVQAYGGLPQFIDAVKSGSVQKLPISKLIGSLVSQAKTDEELTRYLTTKNKLSPQSEKNPLNFGKFDKEGKFTPESRFGQRLYGAAFGKQFSRDKSKINYLNDKVGFKNYTDNISNQVRSGNLPFDKGSAQVSELYNQQFVEDLNEDFVYETAKAPEGLTYRQKVQWDRTKGGLRKRPRTFEEYSDPVKAEMEEFLKQDALINGNNESKNLNNPEYLKQVKEYLKEHKDITESPRRDYFSKKENDAITFNLSKKLAYPGTKFFDPITRESFTVEDLIEEDILTGDFNKDSKAFTVLAQYGDDNNFSTITGDQDYGKPYEVKIGDRTLLMPGHTSEINPNAQRLGKFNQTKRLVQKFPRLFNARSVINGVEIVRPRVVRYSKGNYIVEDENMRKAGASPKDYTEIYSAEEFKDVVQNYDYYE